MTHGQSRKELVARFTPDQIDLACELAAAATGGFGFSFEQGINFWLEYFRYTDLNELYDLMREYGGYDDHLPDDETDDDLLHEKERETV
jgi:hypothetical protein